MVGTRTGDATVLPLGPDESSDPWEMLARGDAALLTTSSEAAGGASWRAPLRAGSAFGRLLEQAAGGAAEAFGAGGGRYRLEFPGGYGEQNLMRAAGGLTTALVGAGGTIAGQARLVKIAPKELVGALGPQVLAVLAVTVLTEMAGGDEQERTLSAIREGVDRLNARFDMEDDARLRTAEQTIRRAHAALLDGAAIPQSVGLASAMTELQVIRNRSTALVEGWERVLDGLPPGGETTGSELRDALGSVGRLGWDAFPGAVRTAYQAIALDSRRVVLTAAEAQVGDPGATLTALRESVTSELAERAAELDRLRGVLDRLAATPLTISTWGGGLLPHLVTDGAVENARTQALFARMSASLNRPAPRAHTASLTADSAPDGSLTLVRAAPAPR